MNRIQKALSINKHLNKQQIFVFQLIIKTSRENSNNVFILDVYKYPKLIYPINNTYIVKYITELVHSNLHR